MVFLKKYNTQIFIMIVVVLVIVDALHWGQLSLIRKLVTVFAVVAALHEIEEKIWPGGFYELMLKKFGMKREEVDLGRGSLAVSIYWLVLLGSAYLFDQQPVLLAMTITLSFFEAFIHTAGIKIHHMPKPYTPGLVTAYCLAAVAVYSVIKINAAGVMMKGGYWLGIVLWIVSFACLMLTVLSGFGKKPSDIIANLKSQKK